VLEAFELELDVEGATAELELEDTELETLDDVTDELTVLEDFVLDTEVEEDEVERRLLDDFILELVEEDDDDETVLDDM